MRKLLVVAVALCAIAWSGAAWAITVDGTPKTPAGPETPGKTVQLTFKDDSGKTVAKKTAKVDEKGHVQVSLTDEERKKAKKLDVVIPPGKGEKTEYKKNDIPVPPGTGDISLGDIGLTAVAIGGGLKQVGLAVHNPAPQPMPVTAPLRMEDVTFFQFGFVAGNSWMKTNADDFGAGLGGSTFFPHTNSSAFVGINAGMFFPVFPGVSAGPVLQLLSGDLNSTTVTNTTPSGIVGNAKLSRGVTFDAISRVYVALPWSVSLIAEGGVEVANFIGSTVNMPLVETFQTTTTLTSPIVGGGFQVPLCGPLVIQNNGICPAQGQIVFDHVFDNRTFFTGVTALSSATAVVKGENRVMFGVVFVKDTEEEAIARAQYNLSDIRLKRDIAEVGHLDNGLGLYSYRYWWSDQVYVGVMAQEVAQVVPDAVMMAPDGYLRVNYAKLGTHLQTYEEWVAAGRPHESY